MSVYQNRLLDGKEILNNYILCTYQGAGNANVEIISNSFVQNTNCYNQLKKIGIIQNGTETLIEPTATYNFNTTSQVQVKLYMVLNTTDLYALFYDLGSVIYVDFTHFEFNNVVNCRRTCMGCSNLISADLSTCCPQNVDNLFQTFANCRKLISVNLFNKQNIKVPINKKNSNDGNISIMGLFYNCEKLTSVDLSMLDLSQNHFYNQIFINDYLLGYIKFSGTFGIPTDSIGMFDNCGRDAKYGLIITDDKQAFQNTFGKGQECIKFRNRGNTKPTTDLRLYDYYRDMTMLNYRILMSMIDGKQQWLPYQKVPPNETTILPTNWIVRGEDEHSIIAMYDVIDDSVYTRISNIKDPTQISQTIIDGAIYNGAVNSEFNIGHHIVEFKFSSNKPYLESMFVDVGDINGDNFSRLENIRFVNIEFYLDNDYPTFITDYWNTSDRILYNSLTYINMSGCKICANPAGNYNNLLYIVQCRPTHLILPQDMTIFTNISDIFNGAWDSDGTWFWDLGFIIMGNLNPNCKVLQDNGYNILSAILAEGNVGSVNYYYRDQKGYEASGGHGKLIY